MDFSHLLRVRSWEYGRQQKKIIYGSILYGKPGNLIASLYHKSWHLTNQSSQWIFSSRAIRCKNNKWDALMWLEMTVVCFRWTWTWIEALILKATSCRIYCTVNKEAHTSGWFYILQYLHCVRERRSERMVEKRQNSDTQRQRSWKVLNISIPFPLIIPFFLLWQLASASAQQRTLSIQVQASYRLATWGLIRDEADGDIKFQSLSVDLQQCKVEGLTCSGYQ